jgi:hypothetical protein
VELYNFIGVRLTTVLERRPISVEEHCRSKPYPDSIKVPADFKKRFGMSLDRFKRINQFFRYSKITQTTVQEVRSLK